ncbi:MAG: carboxypeptidase-like regulatory domain-containing protein, partial [Bacteroidaceae bacterium]|nr:carboxypeptidase-like regulatory domain-containing protein [Bacteroidaceae bacterium]
MNLNLQIKRCALTFVMSMLCLIVFAQSYTVRGIVTDNSGEPIIGANVSVKGTNNGTITDFDGKFTLDDVKPANVLEVSYIGYITQSVKVGSMANFTIMLHEDDKTLDEVVVIGYGTMKKRDITGAVSSVSSDKIIDPVSNVTQALQGKLSGVFVQSTDGRPGGAVKVRVRGGGSITQSNEPLYIVDGFPVSSIADLSAEQI